MTSGGSRSWGTKRTIKPRAVQTLPPAGSQGAIWYKWAGHPEKQLRDADCGANAEMRQATNNMHAK